MTENQQSPLPDHVELSVYGYPVYAHESDVPEIRHEMQSKDRWIHEFHVAAHKAVTEYGTKGDPVWDRLIELTCHKKGRFGYGE